MSRLLHNSLRPAKVLTRRQVLLAGACVAAASALGCSSSQKPAPGLQRATLRLNWTPSGEHAIFYLGSAHGFYADEGIELEIMPGTGSIDAVKLVGAGNDTFGTAVADAVAIGRSRNVGVVSLAVLLQRSPNVLCSLKRSGIVQPRDLTGKTVGVNARSTTNAFWVALQRGAQLDASRIRTLDLGTVAPAGPLVAGTIDAAILLATNELKTLESQGIEINKIEPADYGVHSYGQVLFTTDELLAKDPDLARRMTRATLRAFEFALDNVPLAVAALKNRVHEVDVDIETAKWSEVAARVHAPSPDGESKLGAQSVAGWNRTIETFRNAGLIDGQLGGADLIANLG
jgi:NitT/TauT family transport system substrate-binding protein